jgi:hypothetical protein
MSTYWGRHVVRGYSFPSIVLATLVMAFGAGCNGERVSIKPRDEPTVVQTQRDGENEPAGALPRDPPGEAGAMTATPPSGATDVELPAGAEALVTLAHQDLSRRLGLASEVIRAVLVEAVEWPDASLGCPEPGKVYAQMATPGFRVVLEARGERYEYHTDREQTAALCEEKAVTGSPTETAPSPVESGLNSIVQSAREDLARRLSIKVEQIEVVEAKSVVWPDASVGCPQPGMRYRQVPQDGALIRLRAEGSVYAYHYGGTRGLFLCEQPSGAPKSTPPQLDLFATPPASEDR